MVKKKTMKLTTTDYKNILKFYKKDTAALTTKAIKTLAEHYLAVKLCKCIKNVKATRRPPFNNEKRAISVCYKSVLHQKKLKIFKFQCKKTMKLLPKKGTRKIFVEKLGA